MKNVTHFDTPDASAKDVLLFFHGTFPKKCIMNKDATLPKRLFPNARFTIRCRCTEETIEYFEKMYAGRDFSFVDESQDDDIYNKKYDAVYAHYILMCSMRQKLSDPVIALQRLIYQNLSKIYLFYNDETLETFKTFEGFTMHMHRDNNINLFIENSKFSKIFKHFKRKTDWSNLNILCNENKVSDWGETTYKEYSYEQPKNFNICYLSDVILYDLPTYSDLVKNINREIYSLKGVYIAFYTAPRIKLLNKLFKNITQLSMSFLGKNSDSIKNYTPINFGNNDSYISNEQIPKLLSHYDFSIYIGKACKSKYLGATFYEPLLVGIPVFIWNGTDTEKRIFSGLDCYFDSEADLAELVYKTDLKQLWKQQISIIYDK